MSTNMLEITKRHFDLSFEMLEKMIDQCPDCHSILRGLNIEAFDWIDYYGQ